MIPVERVPLEGSDRRSKQSERSVAGRFLKGPIPLLWLVTAARLPGRTLQVALAIWFLAGVQRSSSVRLSPKVLAGFVADRHAGYRGLQALERAGLISVTRHRGRAPDVVILEVEGRHD